MLIDLNHLPEELRADLQLVLKVFFSEFANSLVLSTQDWKQISDYTGAAALLDDLPKAQRMLVD